MDREEIYHLLQQYQRGKASPENTLFLYTWLDKVTAANKDHQQLSDTDAQQMKQTVWEHIVEKKHTPRIFFLQWKWTATAMLFLLLGGAYLYRFLSFQPALPPKMLVAQTGPGEMLSLKLPDSSVIWLNANTILEYPETFQDTLRKVVLVNGEACFEIQGSPQRPFIVQSNHLITKVLGTTFKIRSFRELPDQVAVATGKVSVTTTTHRILASLTPSERLIYNAENDTFQLDKVNNAEVTDWIKGNIIMTSASIQDVLKELEGLYQVQFISSRNLEKSKLSISFNRTMPLEQVFEMIQRVSVQPEKIHFKLKEAGIYEVY
jgi:transmembrane sensor